MRSIPSPKGTDTSTHGPAQQPTPRKSHAADYPNGLTQTPDRAGEGGGGGGGDCDGEGDSAIPFDTLDGFMHRAVLPPVTNIPFKGSRPRREAARWIPNAPTGCNTVRSLMGGTAIHCRAISKSALTQVIVNRLQESVDTEPSKFTPKLQEHPVAPGSKTGPSTTV